MRPFFATFGVVIFFSSSSFALLGLSNEKEKPGERKQACVARVATELTRRIKKEGIQSIASYNGTGRMSCAESAVRFLHGPSREEARHPLEAPASGMHPARRFGDITGPESDFVKNLRFNTQPEQTSVPEEKERRKSCLGSNLSKTEGRSEPNMTFADALNVLESETATIEERMSVYGRVIKSQERSGRDCYGVYNALGFSGPEYITEISDLDRKGRPRFDEQGAELFKEVFPYPNKLHPKHRIYFMAEDCATKIIGESERDDLNCDVDKIINNAKGEDLESQGISNCRFEMDKDSPEKYNARLIVAPNCQFPTIKEPVACVAKVTCDVKADGMSSAPVKLSTEAQCSAAYCDPRYTGRNANHCMADKTFAEIDSDSTLNDEVRTNSRILKKNATGKAVGK